MRRTLFFALFAMIVTVADAHTLNVKVDNVTYQIPASQAGDMIYSDGTQLTVMGKLFTLTDITYMYVDNTVVTDNTVNVVYSGTEANLFVAGNIAQYVNHTVSGLMSLSFRAML